MYLDFKGSGIGRFIQGALKNACAGYSFTTLTSEVGKAGFMKNKVGKSKLDAVFGLALKSSASYLLPFDKNAGQVN